MEDLKGQLRKSVKLPATGNTLIVKYNTEIKPKKSGQ